jgi:hypothetical protein
MWEKIDQSVSAGTGSNNYQTGTGNISVTNINLRVPEWLSDSEINNRIHPLVKCQFYSEYDLKVKALHLGRNVLEGGDLAGGSDEKRSLALAWCARILADSYDLERAKEYIEFAKNFNYSSEVRIAEAFVASREGDKAAALQVLAGIDSGASHTAGLIIVSNHDGNEKAVKWMNEVCRTADHLDSDGKYFLLKIQLQLSLWDDASETVASLCPDDFERTPILHHLSGLASLIQTVPSEFRSIILMYVPIDARNFPLASSASAIEARQTAHQHFLDGVAAASQLGCPLAAEVDDEYALWLELRDSNMFSSGLSRLETKLRAPKFALRYVRHAIQFDLKLDIALIERDIAKEIAINGGKSTIDVALARFGIIQTMPTDEAAANYIERHHSQLATHIEDNMIRSIQIELLIRAGMIEKAKEIFAKLAANSIDTQQYNRLQRAISDASAADPVEPYKVQFNATGSLDDLIHLVRELADNHRWNDLCDYGKLLFNQTHSLDDAELLANALIQLNRSMELVKFLRANVDLLSQSKILNNLYAWGLYYEGEFTDSRAILEELGAEERNQSYRALLVNLAIRTGDWASLTAFIAKENQERVSRTSYELLSTGKLAISLELPQAQNLIFEAAAKANDDPNILADAYIAAISAGWEEDTRVFEWFERAVCMSDNDGPIRRMTLKELLDSKTGWDQQETKNFDLLAQGKLPLFLAAQSLNHTLADLTLFPAFANSAETDPRRRKLTPAFSGSRCPSPFDLGGKAIGLEATALLTLGFLNLLDVAFDAVETIHIPHSTLAWLFMERQRAVFHQPSRIKNAHTVRDCLATNKLERFNPRVAADGELSVQVGKELADLIAEAEDACSRTNTQHIVVRPAPVYRVSSLMEEEADLSDHAHVLSSCLAVVEKLRQRGAITANEQQKARTYLHSRENPWPDQPSIVDGSTLYLDDLAISYFLDLKLLGKLKDAGLTVVVSPSEVTEGDALISYKRMADDACKVIERIRASLNSRIINGQVKIGRMIASGRFDQKSIQEHPSVGILNLAGNCDALIIDDRFHNKHCCIDSDEEETPILTSLDLINAFWAAGAINDDQRIDYRTRLRQAGYVFIPVDQDELEKYLQESSIDDGRVVEIAELKAIRESFLQVRMSCLLQLPEEAPWLDGALKAFVHALKSLWVDVPNFSEIIARSNWLADLIDIRGWAHCLVPDSAEYVIQRRPAAFVELLFSPPKTASQTVLDAYWEWIEERFLDPIQEQFPEQYNQIVNSYRRLISELADRQHTEEIDA